MAQSARLMQEALAALHAEIVACHACPRLVSWREQVARAKRRAFRAWDYWGRPLPGFGDPQGRLVIVGLAPAAHGGNRTGRLFTGDRSGDFLFAALHAAGFANQPRSVARDDGLDLRDCYIVAALRCAPPDNRPTSEELRRCRPFLVRELSLLTRARVYVALGRVAFEALARVVGLAPLPRFAHGLRLKHDHITIIASYHPSQRNTLTGLLTLPMLTAIFEQARELLDEQGEAGTG